MKKGTPFKQEWSYGIVVDDCPKCKANDIVVYNQGSGFHPIEWQSVQCNVKDSPFHYSFQGGNYYYFKLAISNTRSVLAQRTFGVRREVAFCSCCAPRSVE